MKEINTTNSMPGVKLIAL